MSRRQLSPKAQLVKTTLGILGLLALFIAWQIGALEWIVDMIFAPMQPK